MLYYNNIFRNAEEFNQVFGLQDRNGKKERKNKILLAFIKTPDLLKRCREENDNTLLHINSMAALKKIVLERIQLEGASLPYKMNLINYTFGSSSYSSDGNNGLCEDGDYKCIRYYNNHSDGTYKKKAGKMLRELILDTSFGKTLPEQVIGYLCEEFCRDWETYCIGTLPKNQLVVSKEFQKIYDSDMCEGNFHSCMVNRSLHSFYKDAVDASAAYLTNEGGMIIARCIIYNHVTDEDGNVYRLAERQYSSDLNEIYKRALVDALIRGNYIDGYKTVGAGCGDANAFVTNKGESLSNKKFKITCNLETDDCLSYQDSFKWYDYNKRMAYNYEASGTDYNLDTTEGSLDGEEENYDSYHDDNTYDDVVTVYVHGHEETCNENRLDDFIYVGADYYHEDDVETCPICGEYFVKDEDGVYSDLTDINYCCVSCMEKGEQKYKEENWSYSEYDEDYYEDEDDVDSFYNWNESEGYFAQSISTESINALKDQGMVVKINDYYYMLKSEGELFTTKIY